MAIFRTTRKAFIAGRWRKRPKSKIRLAPGEVRNTTDPTEDRPGTRHNGVTAPATGNRPTTVHSRLGAAKHREEPGMSTFCSQHRKVVGGGKRTSKAYSRPQGETRNLTSPPEPTPSPRAIAAAAASTPGPFQTSEEAEAYIEELEIEVSALRKDLRSLKSACVTRVQELEAEIASLSAKLS
jgi:hypothetical protein